MGRKDNIAGDGRRELQNGITTLFLIYMGAAYPLIMHDKYFDITVTKYRAFYIALCIYAVLMVLAVLVDVLGRNVSTGHWVAELRRECRCFSRGGTWQQVYWTPETFYGYA